jgi:mRNA interferase MazF
MTAYKRGDIVLVPFPFSDQTTTKKRPAVVISFSRYNAVSQDTVIMAVTSQTGKSFEIG